MEYDIAPFSRQCAQSGRELRPGDCYYSVVVDQPGGWKRLDYGEEAWTGPPSDCVAWWKSRIEPETAARRRWAPNDVLLQFFDRWADQPDQADIRYLLALLLVRRRVMKIEDEKEDAAGRKTTVFYCPRRDQSYELPAVLPSETRAAEIQEQLAALLQ